MYKINLGEHNLYLSNDIENDNILSLNKKKILSHQYISNKHLLEILGFIPTSEIKNHIIYHNNLEILYSNFCSNYTQIAAAGGLVVNEKNELLFIFRNGKWDLPKGKLEANETIEMAAIREVEEETGILINSLNHKILTTYHTYQLHKKNILKSNHWYLMTSNSSNILKPQIEEGIEQVIWVPLNEVNKLMSNSFNSIKDVINNYISTL